MNAIVCKGGEILTLISDKFIMIEFLYNINDLSNLKSIFKHGILSKNTLKKRNIVQYADLSNKDVQKRRDNKIIPNHGFLHDYANLYIDARNPMMFFEISNKNINELCVICVDKRVLDLKGTIISDQNAASQLAYFSEPEKALEYVNFKMIFAKDWNDTDYGNYIKKKAIKCAEVLVPNEIPVEYLLKIKVANEQAQKNVEAFNINVLIEVDKEIFFQ